MEKSRLELGDSSIELYHQGAHLSSWVCQGKEQIFLSRQAVFAEGKALRGGVPLCFPQFGAFGPGAKHGFARNVMWQATETTQANSLCFELNHDTHSLELWPYPFKARFIVELEDSALTMSLQVHNPGSETFEFTAALHSYFALDQIKHGLLRGLKNCEFWDNGTPFEQRQLQESAELRIASMIDRVYFNTSAPVDLIDSKGSSRRVIESQGFADTVVWNPWAEGAESLGDMGDEEYQHMLCIESATVQTPTRLKPGEIWQGSQKITVSHYDESGTTAL